MEKIDEEINKWKEGMKYFLAMARPLDSLRKGMGQPGVIISGVQCSFFILTGIAE